MDYSTVPIHSPFGYASFVMCPEDLPELEVVDTNLSPTSSLTPSFTFDSDQLSGHEGVYPETLWLDTDTIRPFADGNLDCIDSLLADMIEEDASIHTTAFDGRQIQQGNDIMIYGSEENEIGSALNPVGTARNPIIIKGNKTPIRKDAASGCSQPLGEDSRATSTRSETKHHSARIKRRASRSVKRHPKRSKRNISTGPTKSTDKVFVRLERIRLTLDGGAQEFRWDKRCRSWFSGYGAEKEAVEIGWLFERSTCSMMSVTIRPDGGGFPAELVWNHDGDSFDGVTLDEKRISVSYCEMESMQRDPLGRQFIASRWDMR